MINKWLFYLIFVPDTTFNFVTFRVETRQKPWAQSFTVQNRGTSGSTNGMDIGPTKKQNVTIFFFLFQVENLKRANNMWTNDSLFLRQYILIPLNKTPLHETNPLVNGIHGKFTWN